MSVDSTGLTYDALGRQVERTNGAGYVQYVYVDSTKLALMNGQTLTRAFIPLPGGTQGVYTTSLSKYRVPDWLGSFRIESTSTRTWGWSAAFAPFGERYAESGSPAAKTFAGHNWDTVNDLYDAQFREQSGAQGRWISPDPAGLAAVDLSDPQTWNLYAYVRNNPMILVDPLGLWGAGLTGTGVQDDKCGSNFDTCVTVVSTDPGDLDLTNKGYDYDPPIDHDPDKGQQYKGPDLQPWARAVVVFGKEMVKLPHAGPGSCIGVFTDTAAPFLKPLQKIAKDLVPATVAALQASPFAANGFAMYMNVSGALADIPPAEIAQDIAALQTAANTLAATAPLVKTASPPLIAAAVVSVFGISLAKEVKTGLNGECEW